jgi:hypothetical protein
MGFRRSPLVFNRFWQARRNVCPADLNIAEAEWDAPEPVGYGF